MKERSFGWVRRWTPRDIDRLDLDNVSGTPLAAWSSTPCLVLLGEGGLGKSHELHTEQERLTGEGSTAYLCDLGRTTDRTTLRDQVLPRLQPKERATLLIDGFDEVFDDVTDIADVLGDYFAGLDLSSVSVRIASRPVVWSTRLEGRLGELWPGGSVAALTLEPVTATDIRVAAEAELSDPQMADDFMRAIGARDLWSLAGSPITLMFLLDRFCESGSLDGDRLAIHRDGIAQLAAEQHDRRQERRRAEPPTAGRVAAARKLAYLSMFGGRPLVKNRRSGTGDVIDFDDVAGEDDVALDTLDAVAQSGIFHPAGPTTVTWAHRSIAELLAADHVRAWPLPTLLNLLTQPTQPNAVAPQLVGVASWIALDHPALFVWLVEHDIAVVLNSNLADLAESAQRAVVDRLIDRVLAGESFDWQSVALGRGATAHLTSALRDLLTSPDVAADAKKELLQLIGRSGERSLDDVLTALVQEAALIGDYTIEVALGRWAGIALDDCADQALLNRLVGTARAPGTNRWIRADVLERLHPTYISTIDLLGLLPEDALAGLDTTFFSLIRRIEDEATQDADTLLAFLKWLGSQPEAAHHDHTVAQRLTGALGAAKSHLDRSDVLDAAGRLIRRHTEIAHQTGMPEAFADLPAGQRHELLETAATTASDPWLVARHASYRLVAADDFDYFVDRLADLYATDPTHLSNEHWLDAVAHQALHHHPPENHKAVIEEAKARHPQITQYLEQRWGADFRRLRRRALKGNEVAEARREAERLAQLFDLSRFDAAIASGSWPAVAYELQLPVDEIEGQRTPQHGLDHPLSGSAVWQHLDPERQGSAITAALTYVHTAPSNSHTSLWIGDAIALVADTQPEELDHVDGARWVALVEPITRGVGHHDTAAMVIHRAAAHDRTAVDHTLQKCLDADLAAGNTLTLDRLGDHIPDGLEQRLLEHVRNESVSHHACGRLLRAAIDLRASDAASTALEIVAHRPLPPGSFEKPPPEGTPEADHLRRWRRAAAAAATLAKAPSEVVPGREVLTMLTSDWDFTAAVSSHIGIHPGDQFLTSLTSDEIATLYLWIDPFVEKPDYQPGQAFEVNPVHELPNTLLHVIGAREDPPAVGALDRIAAATNSSGIRAYSAKVRRATYASTWQPITLADLRQIAADNARRVIRTPQQLAAATLEALVEVGQEVRTNAAHRLRFWHHQTSSDCYVPLGEEAASDELSLELKGRLGSHVTVNREVRVEPRIGKQSASEVDLLVTLAGPGPEISCIVEVKANWYPSLVKRARTQLTDRYLAGPHGDAGVFVVLWFAGEAWCNDDRRRGDSLKDRARLEAKLADAIAEITDGYVESVVIDCTLERHA